MSLRKCSCTNQQAAFSYTNQSKEAADVVTNVISNSKEMELNRVDCVVWMLHESARSFSQAIESLALVTSGPELTMAWIGKDVHEWHRRIAYQVHVCRVVF